MAHKPAKFWMSSNGCAMRSDSELEAVVHCSGSVRSASPLSSVQRTDVATTCCQLGSMIADVEALYDAFYSVGLQYGPGYRTLTRVWGGLVYFADTRVAAPWLAGVGVALQCGGLAAILVSTRRRVHEGGGAKLRQLDPAQVKKMLLAHVRFARLTKEQQVANEARRAGCKSAACSCGEGAWCRSSAQAGWLRARAAPSGTSHVRFRWEQSWKAATRVRRRRWSGRCGFVSSINR